MKTEIHQSPQLKISTINTLFVIGFLGCLIDIPSLPIGSFSLKVAYVLFPILFSFMFFLNKTTRMSFIIVSIFFITSITPSLLFSYNKIGSFAYFFGAIVTITIMGVMGYLARNAGTDVTARLLINIYRFSIATSFFLFAIRVQDRAHFTLYEPSYFAIALIPYLALTFVAIYTQPKFPYLDLILIALALLSTSSASLVFWIILTFGFAWYFYSPKKMFSALLITLSISVAGVTLININERAKALYELFKDDSTITVLAINLAGNRIQRMLTAYDVFEKFPITGVGMNALKVYSGDQLREEDYIVDGASATDFDTSLNAVNSYLEIAAESGAAGLIGYLILLTWVFSRPGKSSYFKALKISLIVTSIALLIESSYLRSYVWALYGVIIGISWFECQEQSFRDQYNRSNSYR